MELLIVKALAFSYLVAQGLGQSVASLEAVYFYMGYLHEFAAMDGKTTIGGSACRSEKCSFDQFFDHVADEMGGYGGGIELGDSSNADSALEMGKSLTGAGLTKDPKWNLQKLITGLDKDRDFLDALMYVSNAAKVDAEDGEPHLYDRIAKALVHMQEAMQRDEGEEFRDMLSEEFPETEWKLEELPEVEGESVAREVLDVPGKFAEILEWGSNGINKVKDAHEKTAKKQGRTYMAPVLARQSISMSGCRSGSSEKA